LILGVSLQAWLYNDVIVDTFFNAPASLAAGVLAAHGGPAPPANVDSVAPATVAIIDQIFFDGDDAAALLMTKGELFNRNIAFYFAAGAVYVTVGLTAVYTMFLLALSKIALSVLIAMGPIFIGLLFFESTKRFFEAWIAQLSNYAFLAILSVVVAALMLQVVSTAAQAAVAAGDGIQIAHAIRVCAAAVLTFLIMLQVPSMAQGLASGVALSHLGAIGAAVRGGLGLTRGVRKRVGDFSRGALIDQDRSRWDSLSRKAGQRLIGLRMPHEKRPRENTLKFAGRS
jgi:type IV secretion system protein VirB6